MIFFPLGFIGKSDLSSDHDSNLVGSACVIRRQFSYCNRPTADIQRGLSGQRRSPQSSHDSCWRLKVGTRLTVEITVANDKSIGNVADSDISYGVSDGFKFIGFHAGDKNNYGSVAPCFGTEGCVWRNFILRMIRTIHPQTQRLFLPRSVCLHFQAG